MIKNYENKMIKLNTDLAQFKKGQIIRIKVDKSGTPIERYWRDRLKDAKIDGCCEEVKASNGHKEVETSDEPGNKKKSPKKASKKAN